MTNLRQKQKQQRKQQIEAAAVKLFDARGFDQTTIEEIASEALVSPATVYNYYGNKGELLLAILAHGEEGIRDRLEEFPKLAETTEPDQLLSEIICSNMQDTLTIVSRSLWAHVVAYIATTKDPSVGPRYLSTISDYLGQALENTIIRYIELGKFKYVDAKSYAQILTRLERNHFLGHIYMKSMTVDQLLEGVRKDIKILVDTLKAS